MVKSATEPSSLDLKQYDGVLLYIEVTGTDHMTTRFGPSDCVKANIFPLDGSGREEIGALIFPRVLQSQLKDSIGEVIVGTLGHGVAKDGQDPPWKLMPATPEQLAYATQFEQQRAAAKVNTPATTGAPSAPPQASAWTPPAVAAPVATSAPTAPSAPEASGWTSPAGAPAV
jgi:hypothetical protein